MIDMLNQNIQLIDECGIVIFLVLFFKINESIIQTIQTLT
jgi:hypothetical protein